MLRSAGYPLIFLAMFSLFGGHWAALQTVAWTGMLIEYSKNATFVDAVSKTFGGEAPCSMCRSIESEKAKESRLPSVVKSDKKFDAFPIRPGEATPLPPVKEFSYGPVSDETACLRPNSPPAPVPIVA